MISWPFKAYFNLFLIRMANGRHSLSLWGPALGRKAWTPPVFGSIQWWGAADVEDVFCCEVTVSSDGIVIGDADSDSIGSDTDTTVYCYMLGDTMVINVATEDADETAGTTDIFVNGDDFCVDSDDA